MFGHLLLQNETYTDHVTNAAQIIRLSVMFLVLFRHLKSLFLNYHVFDSLFHRSLPLFFVPYYWHVMIIIIIIVFVYSWSPASSSRRV